MSRAGALPSLVLTLWPAAVAAAPPLAVEQQAVSVTPAQRLYEADAEPPPAPRPTTHVAAERLDRVPLESRFDLLSATADFLPNAAFALGRRQVLGRFFDEATLRLGGFRLNDPDDRSWSLAPPLTALAAVELAPFGFGASEADAPAGVVRLVPRRGGDGALVRARAAAGTTDVLKSDEASPASFVRSIVSAGGGAAFLNGRLRLQADLEWWRERMKWAGADRGLDRLPRRSELRGLTTVSFDLNARHELTLVALGSAHERERIEWSERGDPFADSDLETSALLLGLTWRGRLTERLTVEARLGGRRYEKRRRPALCRSDSDCLLTPPVFDVDTGDLRSNALLDERRNVLAAEGGVLVTYRRQSARFGLHRMRLGADAERSHEEVRSQVPGGRRVGLSSGTPSTETRFFDPATGQPGPVTSELFERRSRLFVEDEITPPGYDALTVTPGLAFTHVRIEDPFGRRILKGDLVTPHLAVSWRPHRDHLLVRGSYDETTFPGRLAAGHRSPFESRTCRINPATGTFDIDCTSMVPSRERCLTDPVACAPKRQARRTRVVSLGIEAPIFTRDAAELVGGVTVAHRSGARPGPPGQRRWEPTPVRVTVPPGMSVNDPNEPRTRAVEAKWRELTASLIARAPMLWASASYTLSQQPLLPVAAIEEDPASVYTFAATLNIVRLLAHVQPHPQLGIGGSFAFEEGRGTGLGGGLNIPPAFRLGLQVRLQIPKALGVAGALFVEALGLWRSDELSAGPFDDGPSFSRLTVSDPRLEPRRLRAGLEVAY